MSIPSNMRGQLGAVDLGAPHPERFDPGPFDEVEHLLAVLFAHGVAEDGAEQADVLAHRFGGFAAHLGALYRADGFEQCRTRSELLPWLTSIGAAPVGCRTSGSVSCT